MSERPLRIHLHGPLADKYGALHRLAVTTPQEAIRALDANYPGFIRDFAQHRIYHILADGDWRDGNEAATMPVSRELHLVPQIEGRAFLGAALVGFLIPSLAGTFAATLIGGALFLGVMVGLSFLFRPKAPEKADEKRSEGFAFTGPENVVTQGAPVPLVYGRVHCGSVVVSAGLEVDELGDWALDLDSDLRSKQYARIIDAVSDGQIESLTSADVFLDGVPLKNFKNTKVQVRTGTRSQSIMTGFPSQQTEVAVGLELEHGTPLVRHIANQDADRTRITLSTPQLTNIDLESGDVDGFTVYYNVEISNDGGAYDMALGHGMKGKTTSRYQRSYLLDLPKPGPWNIRVSRRYAKSTNPDHQHDLFWDSYTEIIDDRVNYNGTACVGLFLDSEQFSTIPKRTYLTTGIRCLIPVNYDPVHATYSGVWNGTFKLDNTSNPAWILYDILVSKRHGIGEFISAAQVDKWALYAIGQWCDQRVPDGRGARQQRFTCNIQIMDSQEAFDLVAQLASIFRGFTYWSGSQMVAVADVPSDPVHQFTNANVIDGVFTYSGSDLRARHTMATVAWNDPEQLGQPRLAIVEDPDAISRYGIQKTEIEAIGCTREAQAIRTGRWALYTELYEGEAVTFSTGLESAFARPGEIIQVMDVNIAGKRRGGRVAAGTTASEIFFDAPIGVLTAFGGTYVTCIIGDGVIQTRQMDSVAGNLLSTTLVTPFSSAPPPDTVFIVSEPGDLEPTLWRVISVRQAEVDKYEINAVRHYPDKWDYVEKNIPLDIPDISDIPLSWPAVTSITIREYLIQTSPISVGVQVVLSWKSKAPNFIVEYRKQNGNWRATRTDALAIDLPVTEGPWEFRITPVSTLGVKGQRVIFNYTVIGRFAPPSAPRQFRIKVSDGIALFEWLPAVELDVIIGGHFELRHSSRTQGATWNTAQVVVPSIPGSATTVEAVYRVGTWFLRTFDIVGVQSAKLATIIALQPDGRYNEFARICENPDFLGDRFYTEVLMPQQWLVIGQTGGVWDSQMAAMDDWLDVDVLAEGMPDPPQSEARHGWYHFEDRIDAGGVFTVRFSADILAFPYADASEFLDDRLNDSDEWQDWDDVGEDLGGQVQLSIRTTNQDPASPDAQWSDWQLFSPTEYTARGFEFRADLTAPAGQNIGIEDAVHYCRSQDEDGFGRGCGLSSGDYARHLQRKVLSGSIGGDHGTERHRHRHHPGTEQNPRRFRSEHHQPAANAYDAHVRLAKSRIWHYTCSRNRRAAALGNVYLLYGFFDGDVMVYVGVTRNFHGRLWLHRRDAERRRYPIYQLWMQRTDEGAPLEFRALQEFDDRPSALRAERDMIAAIGIVEDGGTLLNRRRSSIGPAGYVEEALKLMSEGSKRLSAQRRSEIIAKYRAANPDYPARQSQRLKAHWSDPANRARALDIQHSDEVQAKRTAEMKRRWADPAFREKMAKRRPKTWTDEERAAHGDKCRATLRRRKEEN